MRVEDADWAAQTAAFCIPFDPDKFEEGDESLALPAVPSLQHGNMREADKLRYAMFNDAWQQVHDRVLGVANELYSPTTKALIDFTVNPLPAEGVSSCTRKLLPNNELPAALVVGGDQHQILSAYARGAAGESDRILSKLSPSDFLNTTTALKQLITGFMSGCDRKGKATTTLVPYDMQLLLSWYRWKTKNKPHLRPPVNGHPSDTIPSNPSLVALIPDSESCNIQVLQEFIYICRLYCDRLPLVLVLGLSKSRSLHDLLPRIVRTHLSVSIFNVPNGQQMFDSILREVLFSLDKPLNLVLGASALEWLAHSCSTYGWSIQSILSHFQLLLMRHFRQPLTAFWQDGVLNEEQYAHVINSFSEGRTTALRVALFPHRSPPDDPPSIEELVQAIDKARNIFHDLKRNVSYGFLVLGEVQAYLKTLMGDGYKETKASFATLAGLVGDGKSKETYMKLASRVKLLKRTQSQVLCGRLQRLVADIPDSSKDTIFMAKLDALAITIEQTELPHEVSIGPYLLSKDFSQLLEHLWNEKFKPWTDFQLHVIWHTGNIPFSPDLLNPSIQATILSALIQPSGYLLHDLTKYAASNGTSNHMTNGENGFELPKEDMVRVHDPDTSRLFHLYMEAGRTINVYDWFEAFAVSLEGEANDHVQDAGHVDKMDTDVERSKEDWRREVYARFMRSLHELDLLGMLRWSGRGAGKKGGECVAKVVWATAA